LGGGGGGGVEACSSSSISPTYEELILSSPLSSSSVWKYVTDAPSGDDNLSLNKRPIYRFVRTAKPLYLPTRVHTGRRGFQLDAIFGYVYYSTVNGLNSNSNFFVTCHSKGIFILNRFSKSSYPDFTPPLPSQKKRIATVHSPAGPPK
jgi:hypothetical protein